MNNLESVCQDLGLELDGRNGHVTKPFTISCKLFEDSVYVNTDGDIKVYKTDGWCKITLGYILSHPRILTAREYNCPINESYWYISEERNDRIMKRYNTDTLLDKYNKIYHNMYKTPNIGQCTIKNFDALVEEDLKNASESY